MCTLFGTHKLKSCSLKRTALRELSSVWMSISFKDWLKTVFFRRFSCFPMKNHLKMCNINKKIKNSKKSFSTSFLVPGAHKSCSKYTIPVPAKNSTGEAGGFNGHTMSGSYCCVACKNNEMVLALGFI